MSWFSDFMDSITGSSSVSSGSIGALTPPSRLELPSILSTTPTVSPAATMPSTSSKGVLGAGKTAVSSILDNVGRQSTILTTKKKRKASVDVPTADTYSSKVL